jgi:hypothetical protein
VSALLYLVLRLIQITVLHLRQFPRCIHLLYSYQLSIDGIYVCLCNVGQPLSLLTALT